jgi:serine/threonine protein kinase
MQTPHIPNQVSNRNIGLHARLSFTDVFHKGEATSPLEVEAPEIFPAKYKPTVRVITARGSEVRSQQVYLKRSSNNCQFAYRRIIEKNSKRKNVSAQHDGIVIKAVRMIRVPGIKETYREPIAGDSDCLVAIKKQSLAKINSSIVRGHHENPYNAIARMQQIGDDIHVLKCIEALQDNEYLYTVMRYCEGDILSVLIDRHDDEVDRIVPEDKCRECMNKVWWNLHYLQEHGIVHHDLSPDNILFLNGEILFNDLAMSLRIPNGSSNRTLILPQGRYGKDPYLSPEVFISRDPFDGYALDLWASACILYNLLCGCYLFHMPFPTDILFRYFIMAKGLSNTPLNERTVEVMLDVFRGSDHVEDRQPLLTRAMKHIQMSPTAVNLFEHMLDMNPANRFSLAQCMESDWAQGLCSNGEEELDPVENRRHHEVKRGRKR